MISAVIGISLRSESVKNQQKLPAAKQASVLRIHQTYFSGKSWLQPKSSLNTSEWDERGQLQYDTVALLRITTIKLI